MGSHLFLQLAIILALSTGLGIIARRLRQPLILAYIFAGIVISALGAFKNVDKSVYELLSNFGVAFLLFLVGIDLKINDLKHVGKAAIYTGFGHIIFIALTGFVILLSLGFSTIASVYMAIALSFSSTVIIVKLLSEKRDLQSLYGKVAVGFLLVEDFVAILTLMVLSGFSDGKIPTITGISLILIKGIILAAFVYLMARFVLKHIFKMASTSVELLFVAAIAWAFLLSALAQSIGFSIAIGAFLAGVAIAQSPFSLEISARVRPLRDFFLIIFFIFLGATLSFGSVDLNFGQIVFLSAFILIGNPLIVMAIMMSLGFRNRTSFLSSITVAQISEFSLILMTVGLRLGHVSAAEVGTVAAIGMVTITLSSYLILYGDTVFRYIQKPMSRVFPEKTRDPYVANRKSLNGHVILVGGEQMGSDILAFLKNKFEDKKDIVVVDFNPEIYQSLSASGYNAVFGDIADPEVLEELELSRAKLIVITDPDVFDCLHLVKFAKGKNYKGPIIAAAYWIHDAIRLYEAGCDYVVVPETVGGKHISRILAEHWDHLGKIKKEKSERFEELFANKIF